MLTLSDFLEKKKFQNRNLLYYAVVFISNVSLRAALVRLVLGKRSEMERPRVENLWQKKKKKERKRKFMAASSIMPVM